MVIKHSQHEIPTSGPGCALSHYFWLFFYESWWVMQSTLTMWGEEEVMRCCGKLLSSLDSWRSGVWKSQLETQDTSLDVCRMMPCTFSLSFCLFSHFAVTKKIKKFIINSLSLEFPFWWPLLCPLFGRPSEGHCPGISSRCVCRAHHTHCGHYD